MKTVSVIVVDDESAESDPSKRFDQYQALQEKFNEYTSRVFNVRIECFADCSTAVRRISGARGPVVVGLDMMLTAWNEEQKLSLRDCIGAVKPPTFAISAHFSGSPATSVYMTWARLLGRPLPLMHFHSLVSTPDTPVPRWLSIVDSFNTMLITELQLSSIPDLGDDDPIRIAHLTDLHVSDTSHADDVEQIAIRFDAEGLRVDFLAITGDVVDKGGASIMRENFAKAREWIQRALEGGWMRSGAPLGMPNSRIMLVPGNHDFRQSLAAGAFVRLDTALDNPSGFALATVDSKGTDNDWKFGLGPFLRFHEEVTGSRFGHGEFPAYRFQARFSALGILFLELWLQPCEVGKYGSQLSTEEISVGLGEALTRLDQFGQSDDCIIVLLHALNIDERKLGSIEDRTYKMLNSSRPDRRTIVLKGHTHRANVYKHSSNPSVLFVQSPTAKGSERVVSTLSLQRIGGKVSGCTVDRVVHTEHSGWQRQADRAKYGGGVATWTAAGWVC